MQKIPFVNNQEPALNATNLNQMQTNFENALENGDLLHYKGHVSSTAYLPSTGQISAEIVQPNSDITNGRYIAGSNTTYGTNTKNQITTTYPYVVGTKSKTSGTEYSAYIRTTNKACIDGFTRVFNSDSSKVYTFVHVIYSATETTQIYGKNNAGIEVIYDDGTGEQTFNAQTWTSITKSGWVPVGYSDATGTSSNNLVELYSNIPVLLFLEYPLTKAYFGWSALNNVIPIKTISRPAQNWTWAWGYQMLGFNPDTCLATYIQQTEADSDAVENNVYTVGENYDIYRCSDEPRWEHWSQNTSAETSVNYSETEHLVGTWIDGKPLYEKTFKLTTIPQVTTDGTAVSAITDVSGMNIDSGFIYGALLQSAEKNTYGTFQTLPYINNAGRQLKVQLEYDPSGKITKLYLVSNGTAYNSMKKVFCTLRYTKTTDSAS